MVLSRGNLRRRASPSANQPSLPTLTSTSLLFNPTLVYNQTHVSWKGPQRSRIRAVSFPRENTKDREEGSLTNSPKRSRGRTKFPLRNLPSTLSFWPLQCWAGHRLHPTHTWVWHSLNGLSSSWWHTSWASARSWPASMSASVPLRGSSQPWAASAASGHPGWGQLESGQGAGMRHIKRTPGKWPLPS